MIIEYNAALQVQANMTINALNMLLVSSEIVAFSPHSLTLALAICLLGSGGKTKVDIENMLSPPYMEKITYCTMLKDNIRSAYGSEIRETDFYLGNKFFIQQDYMIDEQFKSNSDNFFKTTIESVDFKNGITTAKKINDFISKTTNGKAKNGINSKDIIPSTKGLLVSAFHFKGLWRESFNESFIENGKFYTKNGKTKIVKMMRKLGTLMYGGDSDFHVVKIPYSNDNNEFVMILPKKKNMLHGYLKNLKEKDLLSLLDSTYYEYVQLILPRFNIELTHDFRKTLNKGVLSPFHDKANFSTISQNEDFNIDGILQSVSVNINEVGADFGKGGDCCVESDVLLHSTIDPIVVKGDHPFLYLIVNDYTILFSGIYQ